MRPIGLIGSGNSLKQFLTTSGTVKERLRFGDRADLNHAREIGVEPPHLEQDVILYLLDLIGPIRGMSGSPVFDELGEVIGIFCGQLRDQRNPDAKMFYCVSAELIQNFLNAADQMLVAVPPGQLVDAFAADAPKPIRPRFPAADDPYRVYTSRFQGAAVPDIREWKHVATSPRYLVQPNVLNLTDRFALAMFPANPHITLQEVSTLVRNDAFAYAVVAPPGYRLTETLYLQEQMLVSVYDKPEIGQVRITAQKISYPWSYIQLLPDGRTRFAHDGPGMLMDRAIFCRRYTLQYFQEDYDLRPETYEMNEPPVRRETANATLQRGTFDNLFGDPASGLPYGVTQLEHSFYRYRHYVIEGTDRSVVLLSILSDDNFITIDFEVPTVNLTNPQIRNKKTLLERAIFPLSIVAYPSR